MGFRCAPVMPARFFLLLLSLADAFALREPCIHARASASRRLCRCVARLKGLRVKVVFSVALTA
jgi:hypothetical protein